MSLDVYLTSSKKEIKNCWECGSDYEYQEELYTANITHNLGKMAEEADIYDVLWRPFRLHGLTDKEDLETLTQEIVYAKELIPSLKLGLKDMKARPEHYKQFNSENGWGMYKHFVPFIEAYLDACLENPNSIVSVSR